MDNIINSTSQFGYIGIVILIWITVGVFIAALRYPNYSHRQQFCSELGASGSPTESFSPLINNYTLALLFIGFGYHLFSLTNADISWQITSLLIVTHGLATAVAGFFPMDKDPYTQAPSKVCQIHSWAGFIMLTSFFIAPISSLFSDVITTNTTSYQITTISLWLASFYLHAKLIKAYKEKKNAGLYQRLAYGSQLIWLASLSFFIAG